LIVFAIYLPAATQSIFIIVSKAQEHIPSPYQVTVENCEPISVDPAELAAKGVRLDHLRDEQFVLHLNGKTVSLVIESIDRKHIRISAKNRSFEALVRDHRDQLLAEWGMDETSSKGLSELVSPMPGLVLSVAVSPGSKVSEGDSLLVLEAMKMENEIKSTSFATVKSVQVQPGDAVQKGQMLIEFESEA